MSPGPDRPRYGWEPRAGRYRDLQTGRWVSAREVREAMAERIRVGVERVDALCDALEARRITIAEWQAGVADEIRLIRTQVAALGKGGWERMMQADWGRVGAQCKRQYQYLQRFAQAIADAKLSPAQIKARARLYMNAAREAYFKARRAVEKKLGRREVRWVLTAAEHCPDCEALAAKGWMPIGDLAQYPGDGQTQCGPNCKCYLEYR